jgi:exopolysaccharide biosynthesis WecB/TagA/CpsF family protein
MRRPDQPWRVTLGGVPVDLAEHDQVVAAVRDRLTAPVAPPPLLVASANLQHVGVYRPGGPYEHFFADSPHEWLVLVDGAPLARRAKRLTGRAWPRLAGSDLLPDLLAVTAATRRSVAFVGGGPDLGERLRRECTARWPDLRVAGQWSPARDELGDDATMRALATEVRDAEADVVVVGLPKPRPEEWLETWVDVAGARVGLAFGAAAEFLTGDQARAPVWVRRAGVEWLWRLAGDPRRLARRYLVEGPGEWWRLQRQSHL